MFRTLIAMVSLLIVTTVSARAEGFIKLTVEQKRTVETTVKSRLYYPEKAAVTDVSALQGKAATMVCGYLVAPREYHPESRRPFLGLLTQVNGKTKFEVVGPADLSMTKVVEGQCRHNGLLR